MNDDDDDNQTCEACRRRFPHERMVSHVDCWMCDECTEARHKEFRACTHHWEPWEGEWEPGQYCTRCGHAVEHGDAMLLFPLICDGWVEIAEA